MSWNCYIYLDSVLEAKEQGKDAVQVGDVPEIACRQLGTEYTILTLDV